MLQALPHFLTLHEMIALLPKLYLCLFAVIPTIPNNAMFPHRFPREIRTLRRARHRRKGRLE